MTQATAEASSIGAGDGSAWEAPLCGAQVLMAPHARRGHSASGREPGPAQSRHPAKDYQVSHDGRLVWNCTPARLVACFASHCLMKLWASQVRPAEILRRCKWTRGQAASQTSITNAGGTRYG